MSQADLALRAGVARGYIGSLESGAIVQPGLGNLERIARAFGVGLRDLLGSTYREQPETVERVSQVNADLVAVRQALEVLARTPHPTQARLRDSLYTLLDLIVIAELRLAAEGDEPAFRATDQPPALSSMH